MQLRRWFQHGVTGHGALRRAFPDAARRAMTTAIKVSEATHSGQIHVALEAALGIGQLWHGQTPRDRAVELFSRLRVWDTAQNNGVLICVMLADRSVEIVADRGIAAYVPPAEWEAICHTMEAEFSLGRFEAGLIAGIAAVGALLTQHFPPVVPPRNELSDQPTMIDGL